MKKIMAVFLSLTILLVLAIPMATPVAATDGCPPCCHEGLTPGFWKQPQHFDSWVWFDQEDLLDDGGYPFEIPDEFDLDDYSLLEALSFKGGPTDKDMACILLRAAVAALLNAEAPDIDYPMMANTIINEVNAALASGDRDTMEELKNTLDGYNNLGLSD